MDERNFRAKAKEVLKGHWGISIAAAVLASLLGALLVGSSFFPDLDSDLAQTYGICIARPKPVDTFIIGLNIAAFVVGGVIQLGYCKYLLRQHDGETYEIRDLFSQFDRFWDGFVLKFLRGIYVFLWSLLLLIPGFIASYSYAMSPFLMAENPDLSPSDALSLSKKMMDGHKGELFALDLSFIGWSILCILTLNIGYLFLNPYQNAAYAAFYRELKAQYSTTE